MDERSEVEGALLRLNQFRGDGGRAPHKPLLVLLALARLAETGSSQLKWDEAADELAELISEFGPPSQTGRMQSAAYPFTRLRTDGVWVLSSDVPMDNVGPLARQHVAGRLSGPIEASLRDDPAKIVDLARQIVDLQFPATIARDVLLAVGFDLDSLDGVEPGSGPAESHRRRSAAWRHEVLRAWDAACAFCGYDGSFGGAPVGIEAAHVRWFTFDGPDDLDNGLALCSLHHKLFDRGALGLSTQYQVLVSSSFRAMGAGRSVYALHGQELSPRPGTALPAQRHLLWHHHEVFRGDPIAI